jgi:predicted nucleic acid-binding protein
MFLVDTSVWIEVLRKPAIRHGIPVLHYDRDFSLLARVSSLKEQQIPL